MSDGQAPGGGQDYPGGQGPGYGAPPPYPGQPGYGGQPGYSHTSTDSCVDKFSNGQTTSETAVISGNGSSYTTH